MSSGNLFAWFWRPQAARCRLHAPTSLEDTCDLLCDDVRVCVQDTTPLATFNVLSRNAENANNVAKVLGNRFCRLSGRRSLGLPLARHDPPSKLSIPELLETLSTDKLCRDKRGSLLHGFEPRINIIALFESMPKQMALKHETNATLWLS